MCGRFALQSTQEKLKDLFGIDFFAELVENNFSISPTQKIYGIIKANNEIRMGKFSWGLAPSWAKDKKSQAKLINARSEALYEKTSFMNLIDKRDAPSQPQDFSSDIKINHKVTLPIFTQLN